MKRCVAFCLLVLLCSERALALNDGLARTPPMGWNSWNAFQTKINERLIRSMVDAVAGNGMKAAGYQYVIVDAGWKAPRRDAGGRLAADPNRFPSGIPALADYVHSKGLRFGLYTDAGTQDCVAGTPGSHGFETLDAATFAEWGVDYLKEDWCHTEGLDARKAYTKMHDAIVDTGHPMVFSVCEWGDNRPWEWAPKIAHLWRTTGDIMAAWDAGRETMNKPGGYPRGWTLILDAQPRLKSHAGPGHWNDPDMLVVGLPGLSLDEARAHFSLWSILAAPLICGCDVTRMTSETASILLNTEVIAVDQDALGIQGDRVVKKNTSEIWARPLQDGSLAVVLFNRGENADQVEAQLQDMQLDSKHSFTVRDLWQRKDLGEFSGSFIAQIPGRGAVMAKVSPKTRGKGGRL
jgi:alpha-galactosidase